MRAQLQIVETPLTANWHKQKTKESKDTKLGFFVVVDAGNRIEEAGKNNRM